VSKATNVTAWKGTVQCRERSNNNSQSRTVAALTTDKTKQQSPVVGY